MKGEIKMKVFVYKEIEKAVKECKGTDKMMGAIDYSHILEKYCGQPVTVELAEQLANELFDEPKDFVQLVIK